MDANLRIVTQLPLQELWDNEGPVIATRERSLISDDVRMLMDNSPVRFVVADVGSKLVWVPPIASNQFWRREVASHVATNAKANLDQYPGGYCYFASLWKTPKDSSITILLEKSH